MASTGGANIVGGEYGNPHTYGSTMWDLFMPNPSYQQDLNMNLYATGYNEGSPSPGGVVYPRSPIGKLLQNIGLIGEPEAQPLTDYQKMIVSKGGEARAKTNLDALKDQLEVVNKYIDERGEMPPQEMLRGLNPEAYSQTGKKIQERAEDVSYLRQKRGLGLEHEQKQIDYLDYQMSQEKATAEEVKEFNRLQKLANMDQVKFYRKMYDEAMKAAFLTDDPIENRAALMQAKRIHAMLTAAIINSGGTPSDVLKLANPAVDPDTAFGTPPPPGTDRRRFPTAESVDEYMKEDYGMGQGYEMPKPNEPLEKGTVDYPTSVGR